MLFRSASARGQEALEAGARRFAMTLGRALALALLAAHAQWSLEAERDARARASARRFALQGVDLITDDADPAADAALMAEN